MKIAYLILAHDEPELLGRMIARLSSAQTKFYIHIDARKDMQVFKNAVPYASVAFIDKRIAVNHGGFTLTKAMIELLKAAAKDGHDVYQMLSGRDYPVKKIEDIISFYKPGTDYIHHYALTKEAEFSQNIYKYHFVDIIAGIPEFTRPLAIRFKHILNRVLKGRDFIQGYQAYRGSQWFALSRETVTKILFFLATAEGRTYSDYFKFSWGSDEIFFQTLVLHFKTSPIENYLHYIDWDKARENPAVLDESDFEKLKETQKLYARKFHSQKSASLINLLDGLDKTSPPRL